MKIIPIITLLGACSISSPYAYSQQQPDHLNQWLNEFMSLEPAAVSAQETPISLSTSQGKLEGTTTEGINIFRGIKYAQAPVGKRRFAPPVPVKAWQGTKQATHFGSACMQAGSGDIAEDCLYLNVWAPAQHTEKKRPVYVFIHGGGFGMGSGSQALYDGKELAKQGVIVVTLNYRLGTLGFLPSKAAFSEHNTTGNWGLLDIIESLKWVNNHISDFGGDSQQITVGGESAGSYAVSALISSPLAHGLFQQAIMQSGSLPNAGAVAPFTAASMKDAQTQAQRYFNQFEVADDQAGLAKLRQLPATEILSKSLEFSNARMPQVTSFWPIPDGYVYHANQAAVIKSGQINQVNLLAGYNTNEGSLFISPKATETDYKTVLKTAFKQHADDVYSRFPIDKDHPLNQQMDHVLTLSMLRSGLYQYADSLAQHNNVYFYHFGYSDPMIKPTGLGAIHGSEIRYISHNLMNFIRQDPEATAMAKMMQSAWINFIKTGNPNQDKSLTADGSWQKYTSQSPQERYLVPNATMQIAPDLDDVRYINALLPDQQ
jgi:para-nitrobenzyl esterase